MQATRGMMEPERLYLTATMPVFRHLLVHVAEIYYILLFYMIQLAYKFIMHVQCTCQSQPIPPQKFC